MLCQNFFISCKCFPGASPGKRYPSPHLSVFASRQAEPALPRIMVRAQSISASYDATAWSKCPGSDRLPPGVPRSERAEGRPEICRLQVASVHYTLNSMTKTSKPAPAPLPSRKQAVIYARVSSKEQEKEGFSIPAQLKLLKEYAAAQGFAVAQEYVDVETAKQTGRVAFGEMVAYLKAHPVVRVMLVEKTDRLYRNLKDWVTVDDLEVAIHFPKEGVVLSSDSRSSEKFMHGIKVLMAKNYIDNLSEEARKG